jgi:hypothetical protein
MPAGPQYAIVVSATQVDVFDLCERKWAWMYLGGMRQAQNEYAELGSKVHQVLEDWLRDGKPLDLSTQEGSIALQGVQSLPAPKTPGVKIEETFYLKTEQATYTGRKDYEYFDTELGLIVVGDHKTTGNLRWAKTENELKNSTQALIYAAHSMTSTGTEEVLLEWQYYQTKGVHKHTHPVRIRLTLQDVEARFDRIDRTAVRIQEEYRKQSQPQELPPNAHACQAFGGCPFIPLCNLKSEERLVAYMAQEQSLAERLRARMTKTNGLGQAPAPAAPPEPPGPAATPDVGAGRGALGKLMLARELAKKGVGTVNPPTVGVPPSLTPPQEPPKLAVAPAAAPAEALKKRGRPLKQEALALAPTADDEQIVLLRSIAKSLESIAAAVQASVG